jgi:hypothetical protein
MKYTVQYLLLVLLCIIAFGFCPKHCGTDNGYWILALYQAERIHASRHAPALLHIAKIENALINCSLRYLVKSTYISTVKSDRYKYPINMRTHHTRSVAVMYVTTCRTCQIQNGPSMKLKLKLKLIQPPRLLQDAINLILILKL